MRCTLKHHLAFITFLSLISAQISAEPKAQISYGKAFNAYGKVLSKNASNYRVVAVQKSGAALAANVRASGSFKINMAAASAKGTTLQLVSKSGQYQGPIVYPTGKKAATQFSGTRGGDIGKIKIGNGFATVSKKGTNVFNTNSTVQFSSSSGTLGSGKLGLVKIITKGLSSNSNDKKEAGQSPGADSDQDGLINLVDVDDDGDLVLDASDSNFIETKGPRPYVFNDIPSELTESINVNTGLNITQDVIDTFLKENLNLVIGFNAGENTNLEIGTANVDCLNLPYCGKNGAATIVGLGGITVPQDFPIGTPWIQYDTDNDGFPNLFTYPTGNRREIIIRPAVSTDEIGPGDTLIVKIPLDGVLKKFPMVLSSVFATVPAVSSYSAGVVSGNYTYPVSEGTAGTATNPIQLITTDFTLSFWRPQRRAVPGAETGTLIDMGQLRYGVDLAVDAGPIVNCFADDYTNLSSTLSVTQGVSNDVLLDSQTDGVPDRSKLLSFTVNLSSCLTRGGVTPAGQTLIFGLTGKDRSGNNTRQFIHLRMP